MTTCDVVIVGGGPVGLCMARALAEGGLGVVVVEQQPRTRLAAPVYDGREIALTHASRSILESLDVWQRVDDAAGAPLQQARVFNGSSPFALGFSAQSPQHLPLGWLVSNHRLRRAAWESLQASIARGGAVAIWDGATVDAVSTSPAGAQVSLSDGRAVHARLVVAADSRFSQTRRMMGIGAAMRDFGKSMFLCQVEHDADHAQTAWEWFGYERTLALLPLQGRRSSVVVTVPAAQAARLQAMDAAALGRTLAQYFQQRLGAMTPVGTRHVYPLVGVYAQRFVAERYALVGDAAVGMHPVTAHGFNLGLQSQQRLAQAVCAAAREAGDIGAAGLLRGYERAHRMASRPLYEATNAVVGLYNDVRPPARLARAAVLRLAQHAAPFRKLIQAQLMQRPGP